MNRNRYLLIAFPVFLLCLIAFMPKVSAPDNDYMNEIYRPQYHYTAEKNMINDPNGLVYYRGEYHLFHQYNVSGAVHWGHAVSTDLVHWKHLPSALFPDEIGQIWSGSAVVDENNTSGLQSGNEKVLVALFTYSQPNGDQSQGLAYSNDKGRTWQKYAGNPVMPNPGMRDFRDPKIFWHEESRQWMMLLAAGDHVNLYSSPDLIHWTYESEFGQNAGAHGGVWECPDLFPLAIDGDPGNTRWVLSVSVIDGSPAGGTGMQYFVGDVVMENGHWIFMNENPPSQVLWTNYGKDFYAGVTWNNAPESRRLMIAWSDNWQYRDVMPTHPFNGQLSSVRELGLRAYPEGIRMVQSPVKELQTIRGAGKAWYDQSVHPGSNVLDNLSGDAYEIIAEFQTDTATAANFGFRVRKNGNQYTEIGYDRMSGQLFVNRSNSGIVAHPQFPGVHIAPMEPEDNKIKMHIFVDRSSVEVFGNDGKNVITDLIFPDLNSFGIELFANDGTVKLNSLMFYPLKKIWGTTPFISTNLSEWTAVQGEWADTIHGKEGSTDNDGFILASTEGNDFTYSADITINGVNRGASAEFPQPIKQEAVGGIVFRANETATKGYAATIDAKTDTLGLIRYNGDGTTATLGVISTPIDTNTAYNIKVQTKGTRIKVYLNNSLRMDTSDSAYSGGYVGLNLQNAVVDFTNVYYQSTSFTMNVRFWDSFFKWAL